MLYLPKNTAFRLMAGNGLPKRKKAPTLTGGASWIRCFSTFDQRAKSSGAPPLGFLRMILRVFIERNIDPTLPEAGRPVKRGCRIFETHLEAAVNARIALKVPR